MSTLEERLRAKLEKLKSGFGNGDFWKPPKPGEEPAKIRLIAYPHSEDPFVELWFHYGISKDGKGPGILCPKQNSGRSCPICDFGESMRSSGDAAQIDAAKKLYPRQRIFAIVVDRSDDVPAPKWWGFGITIYEKLLGDMIDSQTSHMLNPEEGIDMTVWQDKKPGKLYPDTFYKLDRRDSALGSKEEIEKVRAAVKDSSEIFKPLTTSEIKKRLGEWASPGEGEEEEHSGETERGGTKDVASALDDDDRPAKKSMNDVDIDADFEKAVAARRDSTK